ncbi:hypothetical protein THOM_0144 [Trachipleistophora hominis]|uniref:Uncharacterized protein n=1 Tax=Trachipleistophora hominis TaxID=72359 RepID=L7K0J8_TRAHO|nr:hypothetical protein THOM_0144 [Trachipleistophora hominis]
MHDDLLQVSCLKSNNIKETKTDINGHPFIFPIDPTSFELYRKSLSNFDKFYDFISDITSTTYKDIAAYYRLRHDLKDLEYLVMEYNTLKNKLDKDEKEDEVIYYNEEEERGLVESSKMVGNSNISCMFVGPYNLAMFYKQIGNGKNLVRFMKEAKKSVMMRGNYNGIELCQNELRKYRK